MQHKLYPGWKAIIVSTPENRLHCSGPKGSPWCRLWLSEVDMGNPGLGVRILIFIFMHPIITGKELDALRALGGRGWGCGIQDTFKGVG